MTCNCVTDKTNSTGALTALCPCTASHVVRRCPGFLGFRDLHVLLHELRRRLPRSRSRWNIVLPHHGGRQLRERFTDLSHVRSDSTLALSPLFHCLHIIAAKTAKSYAEPFARRPIPGQNTGQNGSRHHRHEGEHTNLSLHCFETRRTCQRSGAQVTVASRCGRSAHVAWHARDQIVSCFFNRWGKVSKPVIVVSLHMLLGPRPFNSDSAVMSE